MSARPALDHITVATVDVEASRSVYGPVLRAIGVTPLVEYDDPEADDDDVHEVAAVGYADADGRFLIWLTGALAPTRNAHFAVAVDDVALVDAAHAAARHADLSIVQAPRRWEADRMRYYGLQVADPDGNVLEIVHQPAG